MSDARHEQKTAEKSLSKTAIAVRVVIFLLVVAGIAALAWYGLLSKWAELLSSEEYSMTIGDITISAYGVLKAIASILLVIWLTNVISGLTNHYLKRWQHIGTNNRMLVVKAVKIIGYFLALVATLSVLGINLTALAVFSGTVGIGIGFGLQKISSNFVSGIILLVEKSIEVGDLLELDDGTVGFVRRFGARYVLIQTFENRDIMVPNEDLISSKVINWTYQDSSARIDINVGVSYDSDLELTKRLILEAAEEYPKCSTSSPPACYLLNFADSAVEFALFFWIDDVTEGRYEAKSQVMMAIWNKFKENDITIPFPQRDLYVKAIPDTLAKGSLQQSGNDSNQKLEGAALGNSTDRQQGHD